MKTYQYQILRYIPDAVSGEFVNLGLVLFQPDEKYIDGKIVDSITRLSKFFPKTDGRSLAKTLRKIEKEIDKVNDRLKNELELEQHTSIEAITKRILPEDDSALQFTHVKKGIDLDPSYAFKDLFQRLVNLHIETDYDDEIRTDQEVWSRIYKKYFDKHGITKHLRSHTVETENDKLEFDLAWQNGVWNCYRTVSFNHKRSDYVKEKVYKWDGIIRELATSQETLTVNLLSLLPKEHNGDLKDFIRQKLDVKKLGKAEINLITEEEIEVFTKKLKKQLSDSTSD